MTTTRRYFEQHAEAFDRLYAPPNAATWLLRRGPWRGRELAASVVARHRSPIVLDLGCGPGRVAKAVIEAGAAAYVGVDLSERMLTLARERLDGVASVDFLQADFLELKLPRRFDVVLALGLFDYLEEPARAAEWMRARCSSVLVASFTRWNWFKAPIRHLHYEVVNRCPIFDYTEADAEGLLLGAGFSTVEFPFRGRLGFLVSATYDPAAGRAP